MARSLAIIGYGHIGTQLGIIAESIGLKVYYYDIENKLSLGNAIQVPSMVELLNMSDIISLHVPETASTKDLIGAEQLRMMKTGRHLHQRLPRYRGRHRCAGRRHQERPPLGRPPSTSFPSEPKSNDEEFPDPVARPGQRDPDPRT